MRVRLVIVFMLLSFYGFSQGSGETKKEQNFILSGACGYGSILPTNPFVKGENSLGEPMENYRFFSLKALWQNPGYTDWQKVYKGPYYGLGLSLGDFYNPEEVGYPVSYYGALGIPVFRYQFMSAFTEFQFGMTSNWEKYDSVENPYNIVIGGGLTVHLDIAMKLYFHLWNRIDLGAGMSFIHFSNGGFERPNRGFNIYSPFAELRYRFNDKPAYKLIEPPGRLERSNDVYIMLGYGDHQLVEYELDTNYFAIGGLSVICFDQISNAVRIGAGIDMNYWWGLNANPDGTIGPRTMENFTYGLIIQPEMIIDRLTLVGGFGVYGRHLHYGNYKQTYQRLGVRFDIYENLSLGVNVRAVNFMLAEFLEFNMGYRFRRMK